MLFYIVSSEAEIFRHLIISVPAAVRERSVSEEEEGKTWLSTSASVTNWLWGFFDWCTSHRPPGPARGTLQPPLSQTASFQDKLHHHALCALLLICLMARRLSPDLMGSGPVREGLCSRPCLITHSHTPAVWDLLKRWQYDFIKHQRTTHTTSSSLSNINAILLPSQAFTSVFYLSFISINDELLERLLYKTNI